MVNLNKKAFGGLVFLLLVMAALLFLPAWTLNYWQAWAFLAVFGASALAITLDLMKHDPKLLERRVCAGPTAEKESSQKIIQSITALGFIAMLVVPALDHHFRWWPAVPFFAAVAGDVLVAIGFLIIFFVYKENTFTSATIEVYPEQKVVSSGLYALVRHPMYMGGLVMFVGMILSLGSWWGLVMFALMMPALIWRIFDEEKLLTKDLPGYAEYKNTGTAWYRFAFVLLLRHIGIHVVLLQLCSAPSELRTIPLMTRLSCWVTSTVAIRREESVDHATLSDLGRELRHE